MPHTHVNMTTTKSIASALVTCFLELVSFRKIIRSSENTPHLAVFVPTHVRVIESHDTDFVVIMYC
jgi:hypothetical protein